MKNIVISSILAAILCGTINASEADFADKKMNLILVALTIFIPVFKRYNPFLLFLKIPVLKKLM